MKKPRSQGQKRKKDFNAETTFSHINVSLWVKGLSVYSELESELVYSPKGYGSDITPHAAGVNGPIMIDFSLFIGKTHTPETTHTSEGT